MKTIGLIIAITSLQGFAANPGFTSFVRQQQQSTGIVWDIQNVAAAGSAASALTLEEGGAMFQLWTIDQVKGVDYLLDQKLVGAYLPKADVKVTTPDPYAKFPRTRVDWGFDVNITVSNLMAGATLPAAASKVLLERYKATYAAGQTAVDPAVVVSGTPADSNYITKNGKTPLNFPASSLAPTASGEEHFVVHALSDGSIPQTQIASGFVQVWPTTKGSFTGIKDGETIRFKAPVITVDVDNLYPGCFAYLQVYEGSPTLDKDGTKLNQNFIPNIYQDKSDSPPVSQISGYDSVFTKDGNYTMELIQVLPFGTERLYYVNFNVSRTIHVRAMQVGYDQK